MGVVYDVTLYDCGEFSKSWSFTSREKADKFANILRNSVIEFTRRDNEVYVSEVKVDEEITSAEFTRTWWSVSNSGAINFVKSEPVSIVVELANSSVKNPIIVDTFASNQPVDVNIAFYVVTHHLSSAEPNDWQLLSAVCKLVEIHDFGNVCHYSYDCEFDDAWYGEWTSAVPKQWLK